MKKTAAGMAAAILLLVTGLGFGIAKAGGTDWRVEVLDSNIDNQHEGRPVTFFHLSLPRDHKLTKAAKPQSEDMHLETPIGTGSLPSKTNTDFPNDEISRFRYQGGADTDR